MKIVHCLLAFLFFVPGSHAIIINEVMADPIADETLNEWIELYNDGDKEIDVSSWIIGDDSDNDTIEGGLYNKEGTIIGPFGYAIITDENTRVYNNFNVSQDAVRLYIDDGAIGSGLGNDGSILYLYDQNHSPIDEKTYNETTEGFSLAIINGTFLESRPSPGFSNDDSVIDKEECDYAIAFLLPKLIFDSYSDFSFQARISNIEGMPTNFTATGKIEDFNGELVKDYKFFTDEEIKTQRTSSKYSPNLKEGKSYILSADLTVKCNDSKLDNNLAMETIIIKGKPPENNSAVRIQQIYDLGQDDTAKFGETIRIKLNAYKGNTNKESIAVWIGDGKNRISKESRASLNSKYTDYTFIIPIQIKPNCDEEFDDGEYSIIAEGLGEEDEEEIDVEGLSSMCKTKTVKTNNTPSNKKFEFELKAFNEQIESGKEFRTKVFLGNNDDEDMPIKIWSYVYRGSKSHSGERELNKKEFILKGKSGQTVELVNKITKAEPGDYKFKVLVNKNNQKTNNEIIKNIEVINGKDIQLYGLENKNLMVKNTGEKETFEPKTNANFIAHESATEKSKNLIPIILVMLSVTLNIVLIWRR